MTSVATAATSMTMQSYNSWPDMLQYRCLTTDFGIQKNVVGSTGKLLSQPCLLMLHKVHYASKCGCSAGSGIMLTLHSPQLIIWMSQRPKKFVYVDLKYCNFKLMTSHTSLSKHYTRQKELRSMLQRPPRTAGLIASGTFIALIKVSNQCTTFTGKPDLNHVQI